MLRKSLVSTVRSKSLEVSVRSLKQLYHPQQWFALRSFSVAGTNGGNNNNNGGKKQPKQRSRSLTDEEILGGGMFQTTSKVEDSVLSAFRQTQNNIPNKGKGRGNHAQSSVFSSKNYKSNQHKNKNKINPKEFFDNLGGNGKSEEANRFTLSGLASFNNPSPSSSPPPPSPPTPPSPPNPSPRASGFNQPKQQNKSQPNNQQGSTFNQNQQQGQNRNFGRGNNHRNNNFSNNNNNNNHRNNNNFSNNNQQSRSMPRSEAQTGQVTRTFAPQKANPFTQGGQRSLREPFRPRADTSNPFGALQLKGAGRATPSSQKDEDDIDLDIILNPKKKKAGGYGVSANPDIDAFELLNDEESLSRKRQREFNRGNALPSRLPPNKASASGRGGGSGGGPKEYATRFQQHKLVRSQSQQNTWDKLFGGGGGGGERGRKSKNGKGDGKGKGNQEPEVKVEVAKTAELPTGNITVHNLSRELGMKKVEIIAKIKSVLGVTMEEDEELDADDAELIGLELGYTVTRVQQKRKVDIEDELGHKKDTGSYPKRAPVVSVMGHVDAGKTTLLDALRNAALGKVDPEVAPTEKSKKKKNKKGSDGDAEVSDMVAGEAGGITQRVAAFHINTSIEDLAGSNEEVSDSSDCNFLTIIDTPGHAAFSSMRASGASATDVVIVVIAAESGLQPQTTEVLDLARNSNLAVVIAVTKMDKLQRQSEKDKALETIQNQLMERGWVTEEYGGDVPLVCVSGLTGEGLDSLIETVALQAELLELTALNEGSAEGVVLESTLEKGLGAVADVLINWGKLSVGDIVVAGTEFGRVKRLLGTQKNEQFSEAGPSRAVKVVGLKGVPAAGCRISVVKNESRARAITKLRQDRIIAEKQAESAVFVPDETSFISARTGQLSRKAMIQIRQATRRARIPGNEDLEVPSMDSLLEKSELILANEEQQKLVLFPVVIKVDAHGTVSAVKELIASIPDGKVKTQLVSIDVGPVTLRDVELAHAANVESSGEPAPIFAFNVGTNGGDVTALAKKEKIPIRKHRIIYSMLDDLRELLTAKIPEKSERKIEGTAMVKQPFEITVKGSGRLQVAGCGVETGNLFAGASYQVKRNNEVVHTQHKGVSLRHFKEEVKEVRHGMECGVGLKFTCQPGDIIECFNTVTVEQEL